MEDYQSKKILIISKRRRNSSYRSCSEAIGGLTRQFDDRKGNTIGLHLISMSNSNSAKALNPKQRPSSSSGHPPLPAIITRHPPTYTTQNGLHTPPYTAGQPASLGSPPQTLNSPTRTTHTTDFAQQQPPSSGYKPLPPIASLQKPHDQPQTQPKNVTSPTALPIHPKQAPTTVTDSLPSPKSIESIASANQSPTQRAHPVQAATAVASQA